MFVYNMQSKKTSPSAYRESADAKIQEEKNLPRADRHLSNPQSPIQDSQILDVNPAAVPGLSIRSTGHTIADQFSLQQDCSKALQEDSVM